MTDRITAILDVLRAAEMIARQKRHTEMEAAQYQEADFLGGYDECVLRSREALNVLHTSAPPDFAKLVEAALPCEGLCKFNHEDGHLAENEHIIDCPAHYRPAIIELISIILTNKELK